MAEEKDSNKKGEVAVVVMAADLENPEGIGEMIMIRRGSRSMGMTTTTLLPLHQQQHFFNHTIQYNTRIQWNRNYKPNQQIPTKLT